MSAILSIFKREFLSYFRSSLAYVFLIVFILLSISLTWFVGSFFKSDDANLNRFFVFLPWVFAIFTPAVGMRLWAEERKTGTWELLLTLPVSVTQAVVGKFLAGWAFITLALFSTFTMPASVAYLGDPDWGPIISGYFGAILMAGAYLSICSLTSALTKSQVIAFVLGFIICLLLVLSGWSIFSELFSGLPVAIVDAISNFSFITHYESMMRGLITIKDILFFVSLIIFSLILNIVVLER